MKAQAKKRFYEVFDVFTDTVLTGNPVAIIHESEGLSEQKMQAIAGEFNLSETVFVFPPQNPIHTAHIRIFKRDGEMPFAGHPTIGAIVALALQQKNKNDALIMLEEAIGVIRAVVDTKNVVPFAEFDLPKLPHQLPLEIDKEYFAAALGVDIKDVGFENHKPSLWTAGVPFFFVPLHNIKTVASAVPDPIYIDQNFEKIKGKVLSFYLYCRETQIYKNAFHTRLLRADGSEDAATGSAASAFSGVVQHFDNPLDGLKQIWLEQGIEMARPSQIKLEWQVDHGRLTSVRLGGHAVKFSEGHLVV